VYRSRLLLDEDRAVRSASLARVYSDLGFQQAALVEGWKSVSVDPANYSAHRVLADSYAALPRHEIARISELLQAQLLQPININPVQPQLAFTDLGILSGTGLLSPAFNEYSALFERNRLSLLATGIAGSHHTLGDELVLSGVLGPYSFSLGQFHYETEGFGENNDLALDIVNAFAQFSPTSRTSIQVEGRWTRRDEGYLPLLVVPDSFQPTFSFEQDTDSVRVGVRHEFSPGSIALGSFIYQDQRFGDAFTEAFEVDVDETVEVDIDSQTRVRGWTGELQHLYRAARLSNVAGTSYLNFDRTVTEREDGLVTRSRRVAGAQHAGVYDYVQFYAPRNVAWTTGLSLDIVQGGPLEDRIQANPKFGVVWTPPTGTTIRAAALRTLKRELVSNQTLEPTQVAGFNQFFDDGDSTSAWRFGIGLDQKLFGQILVGGEWSRRDLDVPFLSTFLSKTTMSEAQWREDMARAYVYWTPNPWVALRAEYQYEELERSLNFVGMERVANVHTHRVPVGLRVFHPSGLTGEVLATWVNQRGSFGEPVSEGLTTAQDEFLVVDLGLGYRLPKRFGFVSLMVRNLFDERFRFQDSDVLNSSLARERTVLGRVTLAF